jgi:predicted AlkP superfamily pyrophosphatase or phosphodiesterase
VGNGWFNHEQQEIQFWKQSNRLVHGEKVWETARRRDPSVTCAKLFWWYNMYSSADVSITPRPQYRADGRKVPDCYSEPPELRDRLQAELGPFPLFNFWGPTSNLSSSRWIVEATKRVADAYDPTLTLVYLPHLDYGLQKFGPGHASIPAEVAAIDGLVGGLIDYFQARDTRVLIVSEYGIEATASNGAIDVNRYLRDAGLLRVREENGRELLDAGASQAFAMADHQIAHIYHAPEVALPEIPHAKATTIDHPRAGATVLVADPGYWFTYDYWPADRPGRAPDFARTVDIHRKPGYDPRELFLGTSKATVMWKLMKKKLGFRQPLDVIPLDASLVRGTHGRVDVPEELMPMLIGAAETGAEAPCTAVRDVILRMMFGDG